MARSKVTIKPLNIDTQGLQEEILLQVGSKIVEHAAETAPVDTGNYRSQIIYDGSNSVIAQAEYSASIEYGTQAHEIRPKTKEVLHFKIDGKDVFAKKVYHKGTKPNPVMRNAAAQTQKEVPKIVSTVLKAHGL